MTQGRDFATRRRFLRLPAAARDELFDREVGRLVPLGLTLFMLPSVVILGGLYLSQGNPAVSIVARGAALLASFAIPMLTYRSIVRSVVKLASARAFRRFARTEA